MISNLRNILKDQHSRQSTQRLTFRLPNLADRSVLVDLYEAENLDAPAVVYVHGGAWVMGDRRDHSRRLTALQDRGITVASIDYSLATVASYPAQGEEINATAAWLRATGRSSIVAMGASAGAHLAALSAFSSPHSYAGFVGLFGRYDLGAAARALVPAPGLPIPAEILHAAPSAASKLSHDERLALLAGVPVDQLTEEVLARISPYNILSKEGPRLLLMHGTSDGVVDYRHAERLRDRAEQFGVECNLVLVHGANHEDHAFEEPWAMDQIASFIHSSHNPNLRSTTWKPTSSLSERDRQVSRLPRS
ncbi:alpha/beta hydrolase [Glaciihabitans sp. UYNi722]|uniref:alpha/beta hydrolase n=1 Tax=Glaciihabitans sp. UYNi722 TaxID=3156344 RepID=UPI00339ADB1D